jgi:hypothetical protein
MPHARPHTHYAHKLNLTLVLNLDVERTGHKSMGYLMGINPGVTPEKTPTGDRSLAGWLATAEANH